jgi:hypothetical protein
MTGTELETFCEEINGGASIGSTLLFQFLNLAKAMAEQTRPWMVLRYTDTSKSVATSNTWRTAIDLSSIARFNRLYGETPIKLFSGVDLVSEYKQVPWNKRLQYKNVPNTFVYDEASNTLYLNGSVQFAGTLYIDHITDSSDITSDDASSWIFPSWAHQLDRHEHVARHQQRARRSSLSGFQCFTVDEGRTDAEYICGAVAGTSVTGLTRGIDPSTGTSSNSALQFAHRVGANVKITDFPVLQILRNQAAGTDTYSNTLHYASGVTPSATGDLTDKEYVDGVAFSGAGVIDASSIAKGVVELATGAELAASTATGGSGKLVIAASSASSTWNSATAANVVPVTRAWTH